MQEAKALISSEPFTPREINLFQYRYAASATERAQVVDAFGAAMVEDGFVQVHDANVLKADMLTRAQDAADWLLGHTDEELSPYEWPEIMRQIGFCPFGVEKAVDSEIRNANRYWHIWVLPERHADALREYAKRGRHARNVWPYFQNEEAKSAEFFLAMHTLFHPFSVFIETIAEILERYLETEPGAVADRLRGGESVMRLLDYPAPRHWPEGRAHVRNVEHEDSAWFTFLAFARSLFQSWEFQNFRDGVWTPVHTKPGTILVNAGAKLARATNGQIASVRHRVVNPTDPAHWRRIITCFVHDKPWDTLSVFPSCRRNDGTDPEDVTSEAFTQWFLKQNYGM
jgi:isopenicillin N synthase-like dioxygenase